MVKMEVPKRIERYIKRIYAQPGTGSSFTSPTKLYKYIKKHSKMDVTLNQIKTVLRTLPTYTEFRKRDNKAKSPPVLVSRQTYMVQADCAHLKSFAADNKNFAFFLLCINAMNRKIWAVPVTNLTGKCIASALDRYFKHNKYEICFTDLGSEFLAHETQETFRKYSIKHVLAKSGKKAQLAERGIATIKGKIYRYLQSNKTRVWYKVLPDIVHSYNFTPHKSLNYLTPEEASKMSDFNLFQILYEKKEKKNIKLPNLKNKPKIKSSFKFNVGDFIKISLIKHKFEKFTPNFSEEIFQIASRNLKSRIPTYILKDSENSLLEGIFFENELVKVQNAKKYQVEKVLKKKKIYGKQYCLVHWKNTTSEQDSFILCDDVNSLTS